MKFTPEYLIEIILRRRWFIILPFCLAMLAGIFFTIHTPKIYEASTLILIEPQRVPENFVQSIVNEDPSSRIQTIAEHVNSRTNLERIIDDFDLFSGAEYENLFIEDKLERVRRRISVDVNPQRGRRANEIRSFSISYRDNEPEKTMQITNTLAAYFISENLKTRETQAESTSKFLDDELKGMRKRLVQVEGRLKDYRKQYMGELPEQLDTNLAILERLQEQLNDRQQRVRDERNQLAVVEQLIASPPAPEPIEPQATAATGESTDPNVLKEQLSVLAAKYTQKHPDVVRIKKMIADLEAKAAAEPSGPVAGGQTSQQDLGQPATGIRDENYRRREEIRLAIIALETEISELGRQIAFYQNRVEATPKREQEMASLQRDYENIQSAYNSLLERKLEADIAVNMEKQQKVEQFHILDPASLPQRPVEPDMRKMFLIFLAVGLGAGGTIVYLLEHIDTKIRRPEDIEPLGLKSLATIPFIAGWKDRLLKRSHQMISAVSVLVSLALFAAFLLVSLKDENALYRLIGYIENFIQ